MAGIDAPDQVRAAVIRLMQEIVLFTDRPDYCRPPGVMKAFQVLHEEFGIGEDYIFETYGSNEEGE